MDTSIEFSISQWRNILIRFEKAVKSLEIKLKDNSEIIILDDVDLQQIFKVSSRTTKRWRDKNLIEYSRIGNKIFYRVSDIHAFLNQNHSSFKKR
jgi:hypothetical protein